MNNTIRKFFALSLLTVSVAACSPKDDAQIAALKKEYPLIICPVSGGQLGEMGAPVDHLYRHDGRAELVRLCCKGCLAQFETTPEMYMQKIRNVKK